MIIMSVSDLEQVEMGRSNPNNVLVATQQEVLEALLARNRDIVNCYVMKLTKQTQLPHCRRNNMREI